MEKSCTNCCYYGSCKGGEPCEYHIHINQTNDFAHITEGLARSWSSIPYEQQKIIDEYYLSDTWGSDIEDKIIQRYVDCERLNYYNEWFKYIKQF